MFRSALGEIQIDIPRTVVQGDLCVAQCHVVAKHVGDGFGAPPTQKSVDFWGMTMIRVRDGKIVEGWNSFDFLTMFQQLGWVKNPVAP
jgi:predicted ester cyclase